MKRFVFFVFLTVLLIPKISFSYPNGTPTYVSDIGSFCASCHAQAKIEYTPELPADLARKELAENKHYGLVKSVPSPYAELTNEQKEAIIKEAQFIDSNSLISVIAPSNIRQGEVITVRINVKGGNGPVIGIVLVDKPLRNQARPIQAEGWTIVEEPEIKGQDGKIQKVWLDKRFTGLKKNINYVLITDQKYNREKLLFPSGEISYTLKAPNKSGIYSLTAAFLYGTENTDKAGFFQRPSGRLLFSDEVKINVE